VVSKTLLTSLLPIAIFPRPHPGRKKYFNHGWTRITDMRKNEARLVKRLKPFLKKTFRRE
jgi:hypothetical protein